VGDALLRPTVDHAYQSVMYLRLQVRMDG